MPPPVSFSAVRRVSPTTSVPAPAKRAASRRVQLSGVQQVSGVRGGRRPRTQRGTRASGASTTLGPPLACALGALSTLACSVATDMNPEPEEARTVHALIQVRRTLSADGEGKADALASFLKIPLSADPGEVLTLAGLRDSLPKVGSCRTQELGRGLLAAELEPPDIAVGSAELVPAEDIVLETSSGRHPLAPHAFPAVSDWIRGVVYTSRTQEGTTLPEGEMYAILVGDAEGVGPIEARHQSPPGPSSITLGGHPLQEVRRVDPKSPLDLTWAPSSNPLDVMAISLRTADASYVCSFDDALGAGSLSPAEAQASFSRTSFVSGSPATLSLHRVRVEASSTGSEATVVEVRFDFAVVTDVSFE